MFTQSQAEEFTRRFARQTGDVDFYTFDPDLVPVDIVP
jgi:hypothetical protein